MSIIETTLVFAGIPAAVILLVAAAVYAGGSRRSKRYRPGRPFEFTPVWFLASPAKAAPGAALGVEGTQAAHGETGGASDRW